MAKLNTKEALDVLGVSYKTLQRLISDGEIAAEKKGRSYFFKEDDVLNLRPILQSRQKKHAPKEHAKKKKEIIKKSKVAAAAEKKIDNGKTIPTDEDCLNDLGKQELFRVVGILKGDGVYEEHDHQTVISYCLSYQNFIKYQYLSQQTDGITCDHNGNVKPHPYHKMAMDYQKAMIEAGKLLGLNPASRSKLPKGEPPSKDEMEGLIG